MLITWLTAFARVIICHTCTVKSERQNESSALNPNRWTSTRCSKDVAVPSCWTSHKSPLHHHEFLKTPPARNPLLLWTRFIATPAASPCLFIYACRAHTRTRPVTQKETIVCFYLSRDTHKHWGWWNMLWGKELLRSHCDKWYEVKFRARNLFVFFCLLLHTMFKRLLFTMEFVIISICYHFSSLCLWLINIVISVTFLTSAISNLNTRPTFISKLCVSSVLTRMDEKSETFKANFSVSVLSGWKKCWIWEAAGTDKYIKGVQ